MSLTFDDSRSDQLLAVPMLDERGMKGTFYVISGALGRTSADYMTLAEVQGLQADGQEVGGHTIDHKRLTLLSLDEARHEVCDDRAALLADGLRVVSFAYPYGSEDAAVRDIVRSCGYASARASSGLDGPAGLAAETIPPRDPYAIRTPPAVTSDTTLDELKGYVSGAERAGGGWVPLVFHRLCTGCDLYSIAPATLSKFLDWLSDQRDVEVETVGRVVGAPLSANPPAVTDAAGAVRVHPDPWRADRDAGVPMTFDGLSPEGSVRVFTLSGRWVVTLSAAAGTARWSLVDARGSPVASGFYLYRGEGADGRVRVGKLAVIR